MARHASFNKRLLILNWVCFYELVSIGLIQGCLDSLLSHLAETRLQWEEQSTVIHQEVKDTLRDFGINPLHIWDTFSWALWTEQDQDIWPLTSKHLHIYCIKQDFLKLLYSTSQYGFIKKIIILVSKDALHWLKVTVKRFIMFQEFCFK